MAGGRSWRRRVFAPLWRCCLTPASLRRLRILGGAAKPVCRTCLNARAGAAGAIARCLRRAFFRTPYGILANIDPLAKLGPCDEWQGAISRDSARNLKSSLLPCRRSRRRAARRHRLSRQSGKPQKQSSTRRHSAAGAKRIFLPAYSPDLNKIDPSAGSGGLRQAETCHAKGRRENHRGDMEPARNLARPLLAARIRQLFQ